MALIKAKQIGAIPASKIVTDESLQFLSAAEKALYAGKQEALGFTPEDSSKKGVANGYAGLDANGKISLAQLPDCTSNRNIVVADETAKDAIDTKTLKSGDRVIVLTAADGSREGFIWDGTAYQKDSDTDWANVELSWANISGKPTATVVEIDEVVTKYKNGELGGGAGISAGHSKTILVAVASNGATKVQTGIFTTGEGKLNKTDKLDIQLEINGIAQAPGADKDYTVTESAGNELEITWNNRHFQLETDDEVLVTFTKTN